ncbi:MAG: hypothetical protein IT349_11240 [Candidatus Eisenbacteria bacterium]|nr:hypothetical protein [Candidatus Eisenbacteria bacterium]MCC7142663.1 hypothetical protein [Candidatus Eisenbacteria bacterium]
MTQDPKALPDWQRYPHFTECFSDPVQGQELRTRALRSCAELDQLLQSGTPEQQAWAQKALNAYGNALSLLDEARALHERGTQG